MHNATPPPSHQPTTLVLTTVLAAVLFGALWGGARWLGTTPVGDAAQAAPAASNAADWPTPPPTFTPQASSSLVMPTPVPLPRWEETRSLKVIDFTLFSIQEAPIEKGFRFPNETATLKLVYTIGISVDLAQIQPGDVQRPANSNSITLAIPRPTISGRPALTGQTLLEPGRDINDLFDGGPSQQVIDKGVTEVVTQYYESPGFQQLAYDAARNQVQAFLEDLGFRNVTVTIKGEEKP